MTMVRLDSCPMPSHALCAALIVSFVKPGDSAQDP